MSAKSVPRQLDQHSSPKTCACVRARPKPEGLLLSHAASMCFQRDVGGSPPRWSPSSAAVPGGEQVPFPCKQLFPWPVDALAPKKLQKHHRAAVLSQAWGATPLVLGSRPLGRLPRRMMGAGPAQFPFISPRALPSLKSVQPLDPGSPSQRVFCGFISCVLWL